MLPQKTKFMLLSICLSLTGAAIFYGKPSDGLADQKTLNSPLVSNHSERGRIARGGRLYDNWAVTLKKIPPNRPHPSYPETGKAEGDETWRCSTCHGWDYKGAAGKNAKGSEDYTGIVGLEGMRGAETEVITEHIRKKHHDFTRSLLPDDAVADLALFVSKGQPDLDALIDAKTLKARGRPHEGSLFFHSICVRCHGVDGRHINFSKDEAHPEYLGTIANDDPWKAMHKIRNGQPGTIMISFLTLLNVQDQINILSYVQTLPKK